jgi:1,2-diacylglycerol 3-alpha-glucosyltransferase
MRIAHLCLSNFYIDNCAYQENQLVSQHVNDGHDVIVIASTEVINENGQLDYTIPGSYLGTDGAIVTRISYRFSFLGIIAKKLRLYKGTYKILNDFKPDIILFHGACALELLIVKHFVKTNPDVALYVDSHEDYNNSARNFLSKWILHWLIYRTALKLSFPQIRKVLCITPETIKFQCDFYELKLDQVELFPLGGEVYEDSDYLETRVSERNARGIGDNIRLFVQSGKIDSAKKIISTLLAFRKVPGNHVKLLIAGKLLPDIKSEVEILIAQDPRVNFVGWLSPIELKKLLCAADIYVQPGSQSATMQMSLCCRCAFILDNVSSHNIYHYQNGFLINNDEDLLASLLYFAHASSEEISAMSNRSKDVAAKWLDYRLIAKRVLH